VSLLETLADVLQAKVEDCLDGLPHVDRVAFRVKAEDSFVAKAVSEAHGSPRYRRPLAEIEDQVAGRVIVFFKDDIAVVSARLVEHFGTVEHQYKAPSTVNAFDYESDHYVFVINEHWKPKGWSVQSEMPATFEMQVRTLFMHAAAEPQHDLGYKGPDLDEEVSRKLAWIAASAWGADEILNGIVKAMAPRARGFQHDPNSVSE
jgi:ppGpp synthetase/RelA/SpoT-type nucleotidyltranferase